MHQWIRVPPRAFLLRPTSHEILTQESDMHKGARSIRGGSASSTQLALGRIFCYSRRESVEMLQTELPSEYLRACRIPGWIARRRAAERKRDRCPALVMAQSFTCGEHVLARSQMPASGTRYRHKYEVKYTTAGGVISSAPHWPEQKQLQ